MRFLFFFLTFALTTASCSDSKFSSSDSTNPAVKNSVESSDQYRKIDNTSPKNEVIAQSGDAIPNYEQFSYGGDASANAVDFLFVLDNSVSMNSVKENFLSGINSLLASEDVFPKNSKIAVMTTAPANPDNFSLVHSAVAKKSVSQADPGFLQLVSKQSIENFRSKMESISMTQYSDHFQIDGCANEWFSPTEKNSTGESCLAAAMQISLVGLGPEAGITAFYQLIQKAAVKQTFRIGAAVNVLFISDTHDPGVNNEGLKSIRPDFESILKEVNKANKVSSLKLHAIAPDTKCGEGPRDRSYFQVAKASKGEWIDVCSTKNYATLIQNMIDNGSVAEKAVFKLKNDASDIQEILINEEAIEGYKAIGNSLEIPGLDPAKVYTIKVIYKLQ